MSESGIPEGFKMTELGALPEEWGAKTLVDIATLQRGKDLPKQNQIPGPYPIVGSSGVIGYHDKHVCAGPGVITGRSGSIGKLIYVEKDYWPHNTCLYVKDFHANNPKFIYYLLHSLDFKKYATGVSVPTLNRNFIHSALLPLPPLPEQHRIAAVLSAVQDAKEKTDAVIAAAKSLKKSLMRHLFTYGPVPAGAAESAVLAETEIGLVPEGWGVVRLGEVAKTYSGGTPKRDKPEYWGGDILWVKSGELNDKNVFISGENITEEGFNSSSAKVIEKNTLLIAMYGATAGKVGLAKSRFTINQAICAIVPNKSFNSEFYFYYLMNIRDRILAERFGGAQPNLNQQLIKNIPIPLPPSPTQQKIASILSTVDKKIDAEENKKKAIDELFRSLLHNLMTGRIRVNHLEMPQ